MSLAFGGSAVRLNLTFQNPATYHRDIKQSVKKKDRYPHAKHYSQTHTHTHGISELVPGM